MVTLIHVYNVILAKFVGSPSQRYIHLELWGDLSEKIKLYEVVLILSIYENYIVIQSSESEFSCQVTV